MKGHLMKIRIVFHPLKTFRRVLLVLGSDVPGHAWNTACLLLGALKNYLHPVTFSFLCHNSKILDKSNISFSLSLFYSSVKALLLDCPDAFGRYLQGNVPLLCL